MTEQKNERASAWDQATNYVNKIIPLDTYVQGKSESDIPERRIAIAAAIILTATITAIILARREAVAATKKLKSRKE